MAQFSCSNFLISSAYIFLLKRNFFVCLWSSWLDHKCHVFLPFASKNYQSSGCLMSDDLVLVVDRSATISTVFMNVKLILFPDLTMFCSSRTPTATNLDKLSRTNRRITSSSWDINIKTIQFYDSKGNSTPVTEKIWPSP